jgi:hypothetical protein
MAAFERVQGDVIVTLDADLQCLLMASPSQHRICIWQHAGNYEVAANTERCPDVERPRPVRYTAAGGRFSDALGTLRSIDD